MDNQHPDAVQTVSATLAATRWLSVPCPPEYLPALARDVLYALEKAGMPVVVLPEPGELSDHHEDDCRVWYFGQDGEYSVFDDDNCVMDMEGFEVSPQGARAQAAALLAAASAAESVAVAASREEQP